jgi:SAM-dependent methyltransferase
MSDESLYVQFGCGFCAPPGWVNFDASPTLRIKRLPLIGRLVRGNGARFPDNVRYGDIARGLPISDGSCAGMYGSHVLEHLALDDFRAAIINALRYLRPGAIFRALVPDLEAGARFYLEALEKDPATAAMSFVRGTCLGDESRPRGFKGRLTSSLGNARHRWMWDYAGLSNELDRAGFTHIRRCAYGDCEDPRFKEVEDPKRFEGSVAVECRR